MSVKCKGKCHTFKRFHTSSRINYKEGFKRCQVCEGSYISNNIFCDCCNAKLRGGPQTGKARKVRVALIKRY